MASKLSVQLPRSRCTRLPRSWTGWILALALLLSLVLPIPSQAQLAAKALQTGQEAGETAGADSEAAEPKVPLDPLGRGTPRGSLEGFQNQILAGDLGRASEYLDLSRMPWLNTKQAHELAEQLYVSIRLGLFLDEESISNQPSGSNKDGLPPSEERVGFIKLPDKDVEIKLHRVMTKEGREIWLFTPGVALNIPSLHSHYKLNPFSRFLSELLPGHEILGVTVWQWVGALLILAASYLVATAMVRVFTAVWSRRRRPFQERTLRLLQGPITLLIMLLLGRYPVEFLDLTVEGQALRSANTLLTFTCAWLGVAILGLLFHWVEKRAQARGQGDLVVVIRPIATILKVLLLVVLLLIWLDNLGFSVTTVLASLGIGGIAVALAAQDTLKNVFGSLAVLMDKPYIVGERIVVKGHDGFVEEIGLRSTRMRLLDGNQVIVPNETMAQVDVLNIGRRPHIRQIANIGLHIDNTAKQAGRAVELIREIMENHQGMHPDFPPRIYLNKFEVGWLNIFMVYWFHPPDFWAFNEFNSQANLKIMQALADEGIKLAMPAKTHYLAPYDGKPLDFTSKDA